MSKKSKNQASEPEEKARNGGRTKSSNPDVTAAQVEAYAEDFHRRTTAMYLKMMRAAEKMRAVGDEFEVKFITSLITNYLGEIEERVDRQFREKLEDEIAKERARRELRDIIEGKHRKE